MKTFIAPFLLVILQSYLAASEPRSQTGGWSGVSARDEIRPEFDYKPGGGAEGSETLTIRAGGREGVDGHWSKSFPVTGGRYYDFRALRRTQDVPIPRRSTFARVLWRDAKGKPVYHDEPGAHTYAPGKPPLVGSSRVDLQACKLEYSIVSPK